MWTRIKRLTKAIPDKLVLLEHFSQKAIDQWSPIHRNPVTQANIRTFLLQDCSPNISSTWQFLAQKSSYDGFLTLSRSVMKCQLLRKVFLDHSIQNCTYFQLNIYCHSFTLLKELIVLFSNLLTYFLLISPNGI